MTFSRPASSSADSTARRPRLARPVRLAVVDGHHPAAGEPAVGLEVDGALLLENLERVRPEPQAQDVAFPRQQVVLDVQTPHRLEVPPDNGVGDKGAHLGGRVAAVLDVVERLQAYGQPRLVGLVPLGDLRVEIPAVIVEARLRRQSAHLLERDPLERLEPDDDVGDLHAGVVDVVLHLDRHAAEAEHTDERVAEGRVADVADVRGLVRVDGGVLDDGLALVGRPAYRRLGPQAGGEKRRAIEKAVQVPVGGGLDAREAVHGAQCGRQFLRDRARGFPQHSGQFKSDGHGQVAQRAVGRIVNRDDGLIGWRKAVDLGQPRRDRGTEPLMDWKNHSVAPFDGSLEVRYDSARLHARRCRAAFKPLNLTEK